jgi:arylsulfatase A-like enzyme
MNRREFVRDSLAVSIAAGLAPVSGKGKVPKSKKPNVLFVFSDEHRACSLPGEAFNGAIAPNLAKFAKENLSFNQCISNYPVCSPYRGILMTGKWPYQNGIIDNNLQLPDESGSIGKIFRDNGYYTGYVGKWHLSSHDNLFIPPGPGRQGFEDWHLWANTNPHFDKSFTFDPNTGEKIQPQGYNATLMTDTAVKFIEQRKASSQSQPWMLILSWNPPHPPFDDAPKDEMRLYDPATMALRPNIKLNTGFTPIVKTEERLRGAQQGYYAHISAVDTEFARVLKALDDSGQADDTIVVYTSDHGEMMGSHGYQGKRMPNEESCRVPFFVRYPGVTPKAKQSDILFSAIDIYPTLCGLAGIAVPTHCMGHDLSGAMRGQKTTAPESVFLMHIQKNNASGGTDNAAPLFRGVRTSRYTYVVADKGRWVLYDNKEDPYQQHNLIADSSHNSLMHDLDGVVMEWMKKASDPFPYSSLLSKQSDYGQ